MSWWRVVRTVAAKDLRIERRSRVGITQILPFAALAMVMFGFALGNDAVVTRVAPGLVWLATIFSLLVLIQRTFATETADGALEGVRAAGAPAAAVFWGKTLALGAQLLILETWLMVIAVVLFAVSVPAGGVVLLVATVIAATVGLACVGTLYGGLATSSTGSETLLPLLILPVVAPVLIGSTRAVEAAFGTAGAVVADGWPWLGLVMVFAVAFGVGGTLAFGPLIET